jgi:hypothetical protein
MRNTLIVLALFSLCVSADFYDDFSDDYIGDWTARCATGTWWAASGQAQGSCTTGPCCLVTPDSLYFEDFVLHSTAVKGVHAIGFVCRLTDGNDGINAYISPDADLARIRLIDNGVQGAILATLSAPIPNDWVELTLTCEGSSIQFEIYIPSTGQYHSFGATDPAPASGMCGLVMGTDSHAYWEDFSVMNLTGIDSRESAEIGSPLLATVMPNPFSDNVMIVGSSGSADGISITICDMAGREVVSLEPTGSSGSWSASWNGLDSDGISVPIGVYTARIISQTGDASLVRLVRI